MPTLNQVSCGDTYDSTTPKATIADVWNSKGGWFSVTGAAVFCKLQYGKLGTSFYTAEQQLGDGAFASIPRDAVGISFRNAAAGATAVVSCTIGQDGEPVLAVDDLGSGGFVPTSLDHDQATGTAGVITRLGLTLLSVVAVVVRAKPTNLGNVYVGNSGVSTTGGYILSPGDAVAFDFNNVFNVSFTVDTTGDGVSWLAVD